MAAVLLANVASAQEPPTTGLTEQGQPAPSGLERQRWQPPRKPLFSVFGIPFVVDAPVAAPYSGESRTFGGPPPTARGPVSPRLGP